MRNPILLLSAACFGALTCGTLAQTEDEMEIVETWSQVEIVLIDSDFLRPEDSSSSIFGGTDQFLDGEMILAELELTEPITSDELACMKEAGGGKASFVCDEAVLYLAKETHVVAAKGCTPSG